VPESIMPGYPFLAATPLDYADVAEKLRTLRSVGVPYSDEMIQQAKADVEAQVKPDSRPARELVARYPKARVAKFDSKPGPVSELDALIAYLQITGQMVDFATFDARGPGLR